MHNLELTLARRSSMHGPSGRIGTGYHAVVDAIKGDPEPKAPTAVQHLPR
jgi:hypothetical protein